MALVHLGTWNRGRLGAEAAPLSRWPVRSTVGTDVGPARRGDHDGPGGDVSRRHRAAARGGARRRRTPARRRPCTGVAAPFGGARGALRPARQRPHAAGQSARRRPGEGCGRDSQPEGGAERAPRRTARRDGDPARYTACVDGGAERGRATAYGPAPRRGTARPGAPARPGGPPARVAKTTPSATATAALALGDVELDLLPFLQAAVAATGDRAEVHEHVRATLGRDEAVALVAVEPLHGALRHLDLLVAHGRPAMATGAALATCFRPACHGT